MTQITVHDTNYALAKQIDAGVSLQTNYGEILLTEDEDIKLQEFLTKLMTKREKTFKDDEEYNENYTR